MNQPVTIRLPAETWDKLRTMAAEDKRNTSAEISWLVEVLWRERTLGRTIVH